MGRAAMHLFVIVHIYLACTEICLHLLCISTLTYWTWPLSKILKIFF